MAAASASAAATAAAAAIPAAIAAAAAAAAADPGDKVDPRVEVVGASRSRGFHNPAKTPSRHPVAQTSETLNPKP